MRVPALILLNSLMAMVVALSCGSFVFLFVGFLLLLLLFVALLLLVVVVVVLLLFAG